MWVNIVTLLLAPHPEWAAARTDETSLDFRFKTVVDEHDDAAALKRILTPAKPLDGATVKDMLACAEAFVARSGARLGAAA